MIFLGTGAAELYPNPFCSCQTCTRARREGAIPRKRSSMLIDPRTLIDFGPEVPAASQMYNRPLDALERVFITHTHEDHLSIATLDILTMTSSRKGNPISLYLSHEGKAWMEGLIAANPGGYFGGLSRLVNDAYIRFVGVTPYESFRAGELEVYAIRTNHQSNGENERALNYRLGFPDGKKLLYAADTGLYSDENLHALAGSATDTLVMEGTCGNRDIPRSAGHLNAEHFCENVGNLLACGALKKDARVYVTHINQVSSFSHSEYQAYLDAHCPIPATVAYDGMNV